MRSDTRRITYAAASAAIALLCMVMAQILPLKAPLFVSALCFYITFDKSGISYGFLTQIGCIVLMFVIGFGQVALLTLIVFAPYSALAYFIRNITFASLRDIMIRETVIVAFANIILPIGYSLMHLIVPEFNITKIMSMLGGYFVLALLFTMFAAAADFLFKQFCLLFKKI